MNRTKDIHKYVRYKLKNANECMFKSKHVFDPNILADRISVFFIYRLIDIKTIRIFNE